MSHSYRKKETTFLHGCPATLRCVCTSAVPLPAFCPLPHGMHEGRGRRGRGEGAGSALKGPADHTVISSATGDSMCGLGGSERRVCLALARPWDQRLNQGLCTGPMDSKAHSGHGLPQRKMSGRLLATSCYLPMHPHVRHWVSVGATCQQWWAAARPKFSAQQHQCHTLQRTIPGVSPSASIPCVL